MCLADLVAELRFVLNKLQSLATQDSLRPIDTDGGSRCPAMSNCQFLSQDQISIPFRMSLLEKRALCATCVPPHLGVLLGLSIFFLNMQQVICAWSDFPALSEVRGLLAPACQTAGLGEFGALNGKVCGFCTLTQPLNKTEI